jgi:hypothetical protein
MQNSREKFIVSRRPKEYLKQRLSHCGVYSVKAVLSSFGLDNKTHPREYQANWIGKHVFSLATGTHYYDKIFRAYDIYATTKTAKNLSETERLTLLKHLLSKDAPVMIRIGNGYLGESYNSIFGKLIPHWITLWGYNDNKRIFYVYDSGLPKKKWDLILPIGNTTRTYNEILRDWNFGKWQPWCWNTSNKSYLYVEIHSLQT